MLRAASLLIAFVVLPGALVAEGSTEISVYGISASAQSGDVTGRDPGGAGSFSLTASWDSPEAHGMRVTFWRNRVFGWGFDFNNTGVVADNQTLVSGGLSDLAFEDGLSLLTVNAYRRTREPMIGMQPYVGAGLGVAMPQVRFDGGGSVTRGRQFTGPAVQVMAGARYPISDQVSVFGEYQGSYSVNMADLAGGGTIDTGVVSANINIGISLGF